MAVLEERLRALEERMPHVDPIGRLRLIQEHLDLERELSHRTDDPNLEDLEAAFVEHARAYALRKGVTYADWRAVGVSSQVLSAAGITRRGW